MNDNYEFYNFVQNYNNECNLFNQNYLYFRHGEPERRKYNVRERLDPFIYYDAREFKLRFRFTKEEVEEIFELINGKETLDPLVDRPPFTIGGIVKLTVALRFYATSGFYQSIADMFGISKSIVEAIVAEVSYLICHYLRERFIKMPSTVQEIIHSKVEFMRLARFPLCIGAVDGTHVLIQSFGGHDAEIYRNRKLNFSLNVQLAVSANVRFIDKIFHTTTKNLNNIEIIILFVNTDKTNCLYEIFKLILSIKVGNFNINLFVMQERILDVVSRWPGSAHDSTIFTNSQICDRLRQCEFGEYSVIVVDSAYPPERFACKPLAQTNNINEISYQHAQIRTRNVAERLNGQLKREFPILKYGMLSFIH